MHRLVALAGLSLLAACELTTGGGGDDGPPIDRCLGLDFAACKAEPGCVADTCLTCSCTPSFAGCRGADREPFDCPEVDCLQPECCRADEQCSAGSCEVTPGPGCGACMPGPGDCAEDRGCSGGQICEPITCSCEGARQCVDGCESTGCVLGKVCDRETHRCVEQPCTEARTECPPDFVCTWPEGGCLRLNCTSDDNCPAGWCVEGLCQETLGTCWLPPP